MEPLLELNGYLSGRVALVTTGDLKEDGELYASTVDIGIDLADEIIVELEKGKGSIKELAIKKILSLLHCANGNWLAYGHHY